MQPESKYYAQKWDFTTREYYSFIVSPKASLYEEDMSKIIDCAECSREMAFGDCYTSRAIHNTYGLGYAVCEDCYSKERKEELKHAPKKD